MYTQCSHCHAIFRVTMKELTAAQGLLRCGECDVVFDAMKTLSATLPEERRFAPLSQAKPADSPSTRPATKKAKKTPLSQNAGAKPFIYIGIAVLALFLFLQLLYHGRHWLAQQPATAAITRQTCLLLGCEILPPRDVSNIHLLSRNVYAHPNTPGVLTISAVIQNDAGFPQVYPFIEIRFINQNNETVAMRSFAPTEYIAGYNGELMPVGVAQELLLNITDPGDAAVRFQFRFM